MQFYEHKSKKKTKTLNLSHKNTRVAFLQCDGNILCENTRAQTAVWKNIKKHIRPLKRYKNCCDTCYTLELNSLGWQIWSETPTVTCDLALWCVVCPSGAAIALKNGLFCTFTPHNTSGLTGGNSTEASALPRGGFSGPMGRRWLRIRFNRNKNPRSRVLIRILFFFCSALSSRGVLSEADTAMMRYKFFLTGSPLRLAAASPLKSNPLFWLQQTNRHVQRAQIPAAPLEPRQNSNHTKHVSKAKGILAASILMNSLSEWWLIWGLAGSRELKYISALMLGFWWTALPEEPKGCKSTRPASRLKKSTLFFLLFHVLVF